MKNSLDYNLQVFLSNKTETLSTQKTALSKDHQKYRRFSPLQPFKANLVGNKSVLNRKILKTRKVEVFPETCSEETARFSLNLVKFKSDSKEDLLQSSKRLLPIQSTTVLNEKRTKRLLHLNKVDLEFALKKFQNKEIKNFEEFSKFIQSLMENKSKPKEEAKKTHSLKRATIIWDRNDFDPWESQNVKKSENFLKPSKKTTSDIRAWSPFQIIDPPRGPTPNPNTRSCSNLRQNHENSKEKTYKTLKNTAETSRNKKNMEKNLVENTENNEKSEKFSENPNFHLKTEEFGLKFAKDTENEEVFDKFSRKHKFGKDTENQEVFDKFSRGHKFGKDTEDQEVFDKFSRNHKFGKDTENQEVFDKFPRKSHFLMQKLEPVSKSRSSKTQSPRPDISRSSKHKKNLKTDLAINEKLKELWKIFLQHNENPEVFDNEKFSAFIEELKENPKEFSNPNLTKKPEKKGKYLQMFNTTTQEILTKIKTTKRFSSKIPDKSPSNPEKTPSNPEKNPSNPEKTPSNPEKTPSIPEKSLSIPEKPSHLEFLSEISSKRLQSEPDHRESNSISTDSQFLPHSNSSALFFPTLNQQQVIKRSRRSQMQINRSKTINPKKNFSFLLPLISASSRFIENLSHHLLKHLIEYQDPKKEKNEKNLKISLSSTILNFFKSKAIPSTPQSPEEDLKSVLSKFFKDIEVKPQPIQVSWPEVKKSPYFERRLSTYLYSDSQIDEDNKERFRLKTLFLQERDLRNQEDMKSFSIVQEIKTRASPQNLTTTDLERIKHKKLFREKINKIIQKRVKRRTLSTHEKCKLIKSSR
jgi:hypothetical protein